MGPVRIVRGIPYSNRETTLSLIPGAALGEWLHDHRRFVSGRLLDLGCGNRPYMPWYSALAEGCVWLDSEVTSGISVVADGAHLPLCDASFDTLLCTEVLEHVPDAERAVAEMFRVVKPGGHALIAVPFLYPVHEAPHDMRRFTHYGLRDLMVRHGFEIVAIESKGGAIRLVLHFAVLAVVAALGGLTRFRTVRRLVAWPQELFIRLRRTPRRVGGLSSRVSLGYMVVARRA